MVDSTAVNTRHVPGAMRPLLVHRSQAEEAAKKGPECALKNRILFHVSHKLLDENKLMAYHQKLTDTNEDQLSLAAIHYFRSHFQEVTLDLVMLF